MDNVVDITTRPKKTTSAKKAPIDNTQKQDLPNNIHAGICMDVETYEVICAGLLHAQRVAKIISYIMQTEDGESYIQEVVDKLGITFEGS